MQFRVITNYVLILMTISVALFLIYNYDFVHVYKFFVG